MFDLYPYTYYEGHTYTYMMYASSPYGMYMAMHVNVFGKCMFCTCSISVDPTQTTKSVVHTTNAIIEKSKLLYMLMLPLMQPLQMSPTNQNGRTDE